MAGWMLLVLLINEVDEVYVGKADKKSERCCICIFVSFRVDPYFQGLIGPWLGYGYEAEKKSAFF